VLAWVITSLAVAALKAPIGRIAALYGSQFEVTALGLADAGRLLLTGVALGWLGSFISASRHLRQIEPS